MNYQNMLKVLLEILLVSNVFKVIVLLYSIKVILFMYIDTGNNLSRNNNAAHDNEEMEPIDNELFSDQGMKPFSKLLNSGE